MNGSEFRAAGAHGDQRLCDPSNGRGEVQCQCQDSSQMGRALSAALTCRPCRSQFGVRPPDEEVTSDPRILLYPRGPTADFFQMLFSCRRSIDSSRNRSPIVRASFQEQRAVPHLQFGAGCATLCQSADSHGQAAGESPSSNLSSKSREYIVASKSGNQEEPAPA